MVYPSYLATLFKFFRETLPVLSSSNNLKAFKISYLGSLSEILPVINSIKSANYMTPFPSLSTSEIIFLTSSFLGSKPRALMATFNSLESIYPNLEYPYQHLQYRTSQKPIWFIVFALLLVRFWLFLWVSREPFPF